MEETEKKIELWIYIDESRGEKKGSQEKLKVSIEYRP
jgi:hypothetical protein